MVDRDVIRMIKGIYQRKIILHCHFPRLVEFVCFAHLESSFDVFGTEVKEHQASSPTEW
jgi:hypothetical protein